MRRQLGPRVQHRDPDFAHCINIASEDTEEIMDTTPRGWIRASLALSLLVVLVPASVWAQNSGQAELPDSPGSVVAHTVIEARLLQEQSSAAAPASQSSPPQSQSSPQPVQPQAQSSPSQKPVGTAAAETPATLGVAASNPSGAAIAPAKQKRARTVLIRVGAILGAGVALGTVAALSSASPSKPPGSH
jgi:hypothetical protein